MTDARRSIPELECRAIHLSNVTPSLPDVALLHAVAQVAVPSVADARRKPWSMRIGIGELLFSSESLVDAGLGDPANRFVLMLCGAALENVRIALHHRGRACATVLLPDPGDPSLIASIRPLTQMMPHTEDAVLRTLLPPHARRRTLHHRNGLLSPALLSLYRHAVRCSGAWLDVVADDRRRALLGDIVSDACAGRREYASSAVPLPPHDGEGSHRCGRAVDARAFGELLGSLGGRIGSLSDPELTEAGSLRERIVDSPVLCILGTAGNTPSDCIMAGRALQRLLLHAAAQAMSCTFFPKPLEQPRYRDAVKTVQFGEGTPQAILRLDFEEQESGIAQPLASAAYH
jgi:hypothetical protein